MRAPLARWLGSAALYYAVLFVLQWRWPGLVGTVLATSGWRSLNWGYALVFAGFGVVLQGAITRAFHRTTPALWRPQMLLTGAVLAAAHVWIGGVRAGTATPVELWLSAVLGLALAALAARALPRTALLRWYGVRG